MIVQDSNVVTAVGVGLAGFLFAAAPAIADTAALECDGRAVTMTGTDGAT